MTGIEFNTEMHLCEMGDVEGAHYEADKVLMKAIRQLTKNLPDAATWECGIARYQDMTKWYA